MGNHRRAGLSCLAYLVSTKLAEDACETSIFANRLTGLSFADLCPSSSVWCNCPFVVNYLLQYLDPDHSVSVPSLPLFFEYLGS